MIGSIIKNLQGKINNLKKEKPFSNDKRFRRKSKNAEYYFKEGNYFYKLGLYKEALKDFNYAIRLDPTFLEAYHSRAVTKDKLCFHNSAITDYRIILKSNPSDERALKNKNTIKSRFVTSI